MWESFRESGDLCPFMTGAHGPSFPCEQDSTFLYLILFHMVIELH